MQYGSKHTETPAVPAGIGSPLEADAYTRGLKDGRVLNAHDKTARMFVLVVGVVIGLVAGTASVAIKERWMTEPAQHDPRVIKALEAMEIAGKERLRRCTDARAAADRKHLQFLEMCQLNLAAACSDGHCGPERAFGVDLEPGLLHDLAQPVRQ